MSETVHCKGKLVYKNYTPEEYAREQFGKDSVMPDYYESTKEWIEGVFHDAVVVIGEDVYEVDRESIDPDNEIMKAKKLGDGNIEFEVKYYNGGCGFKEAIEDSISRSSQQP